MASQTQPVAQESSRETMQKVKRDRFAWWQSLIILAATLIICLTAGYLISKNFLWKDSNSEINKQLTYYKAQVDDKPNDANLRVQLGYTYFLKGDDDNAINELNTATNLDKNNYTAYLNLAIVYDKENSKDNALKNASKASKLAPQDYKSKLLLGRSYRKLKMYKQAEEALNSAYRLKPGNVDVIYETGLVAEDQGKIKDAEKIYKEALTFDPTFKRAQDALDRVSKKK